MFIFKKIKDFFVSYKKTKDFEKSMREIDKLIEEETDHYIEIAKHYKFDPKEQELKGKIILAQLTDEVLNPKKINPKKKSKNKPKKKKL